jgi:hypothetical protein
MKAKHRANKVLIGAERDQFDAQKAHREMLTPLEQVRLHCLHMLYIRITSSICITSIIQLDGVNAA